MSRDMTKPIKWHVRPAKTQISLGIRPVWSESSLSAWRKLGSWATDWAHSEDSDQTGRMPRLICVFTGHTVTLLVLSCRGSHHFEGAAFVLKLKCCYHVQKHRLNTFKGLCRFINVKWAASWQKQQTDCAPSEDSDQPGHPPSLIRVFVVRSMGS